MRKIILIVSVIIFFSFSMKLFGGLPDGSVEISGVTETKDGNKFIAHTLNFDEPVDMRGKQISYSAFTENSSALGFVQFLFYNENSEKPCLGFVSWSHAIGVESQRYTMNPFQAKYQQPEWQVVDLIEEPAERINRMMITLGSTENNVKISAKFSDFELSDAPEVNRFPKLKYSDAPVNILHPVTLYSKEDIERGKRNVIDFEWAQNALEKSRQRADGLLDRDIELLVPDKDVFNFVGCPVCAKGDDSWILRSDFVSMECRYCHAVYPSELLKEEHSMVVPVGNSGKVRSLSYYLGEKIMYLGDTNLGNRYFLSSMLRNRQSATTSFTSHLGYVYALTGEEVYAQRAREILLRFAEVYPGYLLKFRTSVYKTPEFNYMAGKLGGWKYGDSDKIISLGIAYDLTVNSGLYSNEDKLKIENGIFREFVNLITAHRANADVTTNAVPAHLTAAAFCAALLDDDDLMRNYVLNGEGSFIPLIEKMYNRDGVWNENSASYTIMSNNPLIRLAEVINSYNHRQLDERKIDTEAWRNIFAILGYQIMPDGFLPPVNDSNWQEAFPSQYAEITYSNYPTPRNLGLLQNSIDMNSGTEYSVFKRDADVPAATVEEIERFYSTSIVASANWAILRPELSPKSTALLFDYGFYANGHSHSSNLNFLFYDRNKELVYDFGYMGWAHELRQWQVSPLAHNMVSVDGEMPKNTRRGELRFLGGTELVQVVSAESSDVFENCSRNRRTLFLVSIDKNNHYVVDMTDVKGGEKHLYTLLINGKNDIVDQASGGEPMEWGNGFFTGANSVSKVWSKKGSANGDDVFNWNFEGENIRLFWVGNEAQELILSKVPGNRMRSMPARNVDAPHFSSLTKSGVSENCAVISVSDKIKSVSRLKVAAGQAIRVEHETGYDIVIMNESDKPEFAVFRADNGRMSKIFTSEEESIGKVIDMLPEKDNVILVEFIKKGVIFNSKYIFFDNRRDGGCRILRWEETPNGVKLYIDPLDGEFMEVGDTFRVFNCVSE